MAGGLIQFTNNASSKLASPITDVAGTLTVLSGEGAKFPQPSGGTYFYATLVDSNNNIEIVRVTARSNDVMTIVRAQDGTTARAFVAQTYIAVLIPRVALQSFLQDNGGTVNGTYTFNSAVSFTAGVSFSGGGASFTFPSGTGNTGEGVAQWDTTNNLLRIGGGGGVTKTLADLDSTQTLTNKTLTTPVIAQLGNRTITQNGVTTGNSSMATATAALGEFEVRNNNTGAAMMCFHRQSAFAAYFGIDTDNKWKVGGWSTGAVAHAIYHEGNPPPAGAPIVPSGTAMIFFQSAAPTGWTKVTTQNDKVLRVVSGTGGGAGGTAPFSTVFGRTATDAHTLTSAQMPVHAHGAVDGTWSYTVQKGGAGTVGVYIGSDLSGTGSTANAGSGGAHSHNIDLRVQHIDVIICTKD